MEKKELLELVAAHANFYKFYRREIDFEDIYENLQEYFSDPEAVRKFYKSNYQPSLDGIFLIDSVHRIFVKDRRLMCVVKWVRFPLEIDNPENFLDINDVSPDFIIEYLKDHMGELQKAFTGLVGPAIDRYLEYFHDYPEIYCILQNQLASRAKRTELPKSTKIREAAQNSVQAPQKQVAAGESLDVSLETEESGSYEVMKPDIADMHLSTAEETAKTAISVQDSSSTEDPWTESATAKTVNPVLEKRKAEPASQVNAQEGPNLEPAELLQAILMYVTPSSRIPESSPTFSYKEMVTLIHSPLVKGERFPTEIESLEIVKDAHNRYYLQINGINGPIVLMQELAEIPHLERAFLLSSINEIWKHEDQRILYEIDGNYVYRSSAKNINMRELCQNKLLLCHFNHDVCSFLSTK